VVADMTPKTRPRHWAPGLGLAALALLTIVAACGSEDTVTSTPTATPRPTAPTPTATPNCEITVTGRVYDKVSGQDISGAVISAQLSVPRTFQVTSGSDGSYSLLLPDPYGCRVEGLEVAADGYHGESLAVTAAALQAEPVRNFALSAVDGGRRLAPL
jgi:carboxypeptidase family protein